MLAITGELGRLEEFFSEVVYPAWPLWLLGAVVVLVAAGYFALRLGFHQWALAHRIMTGTAVTIAVIIVAPLGYYTVPPLFERKTVCEASPIAGADAGSDDCAGAVSGTVLTSTPEKTAPPSTGVDPPDTPATGTEPIVVAEGQFRGADDFHFGEGQALLIETEPGKYVLRFEQFSVRNGPDLFVYLSPDANGYGAGALKLGGLKGTDGAFNYDIPEGTDVSRFKGAIVWCDQFSVLFATAAFM